MKRFHAPRETCLLSLFRRFKLTCKSNAPLYRCICELYCICPIYGVARRWKDGFYYSQSDATSWTIPSCFDSEQKSESLFEANMQITLFNEPAFERSRESFEKSRGDRLREKRFESMHEMYDIMILHVFLLRG